MDDSGKIGATPEGISPGLPQHTHTHTMKCNKNNLKIQSLFFPKATSLTKNEKRSLASSPTYTALTFLTEKSASK